MTYSVKKVAAPLAAKPVSKTVQPKPDAPIRTKGSLLRYLTPALVIIGCMIGISLVDYFFLMHLSLRLDESQSLWQSSHSIRGLLYVVALDVHVPLYHLILHYWIFFFGDGVVAVRSLSLLFFLATIPVVYLIAKQIVSRNWALFFVVFFTFSPFLDWYSSEARMYTLLMLMSSLSQLFFLRILRTGKGWIWFTIINMIGAYSHYFFLFTLAGEGIYFLFNRKKFAKGSFWRFSAVAVAVMTFLSPWLYYFHKLGSASGSRPLLVRPSTVDFSNAYSQFIFGFQNNHINTILLSSWPIIMLLALLAIARGKRLSPAMIFLATMATIPVIMAYVLSLIITPFFLSRYMISCVTPLFIVLIWCFANYARRAAIFTGALVLVVSMLASFQQITSAQTPVKEDYSQAVAYINANVQPQDLVVISAPFTIYPVEYYYHGSAQIETLPLWDQASGYIPGFNAKTLPAQVIAQNMHHRNIYLLLSQDQGYEDVISKYYLTHFKQLSHHTYSPDLTLYVYRVGYYTVPALGTPATQQSVAQ